MNKIIEKFEEIRDLAYEIGPLHEGEDLIKYGRGGCGSKNRYLAKYFYDLGYKVKVCFTPYQWADLEFLPEEIKNHPKAQRIGDHVYLKVLLNDKWVLIDASWDKGLFVSDKPSRDRFSVNLNWDAKSDQIPAVKITKETCMDYPEPYLSWRAENKKQSRITKEDVEFRELMNDWLNKIRNK